MSKAQVRRLAAIVALPMIVAACADSPDSDGSGDTPVEGGSATLALGQQGPDFIFPFVDAQHRTVTNISFFQQLMYRPLYWLGKDGAPVLNEELSLAEPPQWSDDGRTVTIQLKDWSWSDGTQVTPRNVAFWMGLLESNTENYGRYTPGGLPDNLAEIQYDDDAGTVTIELEHPVAKLAFLSNELSKIIPLPLAWDMVSPDQEATCSSYDPNEQAESCSRVYEYLMEQNRAVDSYATNPLWQVVNGPWKLDEYTSGRAVFVPNPEYSGPNSPQLEELVLETYASMTAQYNVMSSTQEISVGAVPFTNLNEATAEGEVESPLPGYTIAPAYFWGLNFFLLNYNNPEVGPLLRQLYIRQALQSSLDQQTAVDVVYKGLAYVTTGPIPMEPDNPYIPPVQEEELYPFDIDRAQQYLTENGWTISPDGPATCADPGTGPGQCGKGIEEGQELRILLETVGGLEREQWIQQFVTDASQAGIEIDMRVGPTADIVGKAVPCEPSEPTCEWEMIDWGGVAYPGAYPTGQEWFMTGASTNVGSYSDPTMDELIERTLVDSDLDVLHEYAAYAAEQLPGIFTPKQAAPVYLIRDDLRGVEPISALLNITPEDWYFVE